LLALFLVLWFLLIAASLGSLLLCAWVDPGFVARRPLPDTTADGGDAQPLAFPNHSSELELLEEGYLPPSQTDSHTRPSSAPGNLPPGYPFHPMTTNTSNTASPNSSSRALPRDLQAQRMTAQQGVSPHLANAVPTYPKVVTINGTQVFLKFCSTCEIWRPPRTSHCSVCDRCVLRHDHHCPWTANCIGVRNYRFFVTFLFITTALDLFAFSLCVHTLYLLGEERYGGNFVAALSDHPVPMVLGVLTFMLAWNLGGLSGYHMFLISHNLTTHEQVGHAACRR
jgi:hypothetical protein